LKSHIPYCLWCGKYRVESYKSPCVNVLKSNAVKEWSANLKADENDYRCFLEDVITYQQSNTQSTSMISWANISVNYDYTSMVK
jgi:hypothetical protein